VKLSIVIICWNDLKCIGACLESVYRETTSDDFEVIVTDNGSTDGSVDYIRKNFPAVRLVENGRNLGFGGANNQGFKAARGHYVLILNPDTVILDRAIEKLTAFADRNPTVSAFGCRILNPDRSYQRSAYPVPTVRSHLIAALNLRFLSKLSPVFLGEHYTGWEGNTEREIGFQAGCCLLIRGALLRTLNGFDERLFFQTEDADLCLRVWKSGSPVIFYPDAEVIHIGGQNRGTYPLPVVVETQRSYYRFFFKHYGVNGIKRLRRIFLLRNCLRLMGYRLRRLLGSNTRIDARVTLHRTLLTWHWRIDPVSFIETGAEPETDCKPFAPAPKMIDSPTSAN